MNDLNVLLNYRRMKNIKRCNNFPTLVQEDVAQHSFYVAMIAMALVDEYNTWADSIDFESSSRPLINSEITIRKAMLHDIEESFTSDIPWNIKHSSEELHDLIAKAIEDKMHKVYAGASTMCIYQRLNKGCKQGLEGAIVEVADMLELAIYLYEEKAMGNSYIGELLTKAIKLIRAYPMFTTLVESSPLFNSIMNMIESNPSGENILQID